MKIPCPVCGGKGHMNEVVKGFIFCIPCVYCRGEGKVTFVERKENVLIEFKLLPHVKALTLSRRKKK